jgi:crotonobetaine/carnitine-CoA ligase
LRCLLEQRVALHPERTAVVFEDRRQTYAELNESVDRAANVLGRLGVGVGTRVALMLPNSAEMVWLWLALSKVGAVMVPVNTRLKGESLRYLLEHARISIAFVHRDHREVFGAAAPGQRVIDATRLESMLRAAPSSPPAHPSLEPDDLAAIIYTSGTTGRPKGVLIGRQAQARHGLNYSGLLGIRERETAYAFLPLFHVTAMGTVLGSLLAGATVAIDRGFNPFGFWDRVRRHNAVIFTFVGSVVPMLFARPARADDAGNPVRRAVGAATPARIWRDFERRFGLEIFETYGQTEMVALWFMPPPEGGRVGTVGKPPAERFEARIVDERGRPVSDNVRGEIALRPADPLDIALGYLDDLEATAAAFKLDGWYHTGDLGTRDADGYFRYAGRLKDCIRRRGENISAFEVEQVVNAHPGVLESAAVGVPSEYGEEEVKLVVVPRPGIELTPRSVVDYCRDGLADFMLPRYVQIRDSLPKTATERVQKGVLQDEGVAGCWQSGGRRVDATR